MESTYDIGFEFRRPIEQQDISVEYVYIEAGFSFFNVCKMFRQSRLHVPPEEVSICREALKGLLSLSSICISKDSIRKNA